MTTINDIADFARIVREQPEWADTIRAILLGKDLLDLPKQFAAFVRLTNQRLQLLEGRYDALDDRLARFIEATDRNFQLVHERMDQMNVRINQVDGKLDNRFGMTYEYKVQKNIPALAARYLNVRRTRVRLGGLIMMDADLDELIEQAEDDGVITDQQNIESRSIDLIFTCRRRADGADMHVVTEISVTINDNDIIRAAERAVILASVVGQPVTPAVVGTNIDDTRAALAAANNVAVILMPDD